MAKEQINTFDDDAIRKIARSVRRLQGQYRNLRNQLQGTVRGEIGFTIRTGITTVNSKFPVYPTTGCKFVLRFEDWAFEESVGTCDLDTKPWPAKYVVGKTLDGSYLDEGTRVIFLKTPGKKGRRWWILPFAPVLAEATLAEDMCQDDDEVTVEDPAYYMPACVEFTPTKITNPRRHAGPEGSKILMYRKACVSAETGLVEAQWVVIDVELRDLCVVIGAESRTACMVMAGMKMPLEWCPANEPTLAKNIVPYTDCTEDLGACDLSWDFEPLFACATGE